MPPSEPHSEQVDSQDYAGENCEQHDVLRNTSFVQLTPKFSCKHATTIAAKPHPKSACQRSLGSVLSDTSLSLVPLLQCDADNAAEQNTQEGNEAIVPNVHSLKKRVGL